MKKKILGILTITIILVLIFMVVNKGEKGSFEEVILDNYKEESFDRVSMTKYPTDENDYIDKRSERSEHVDKLLALFKDLEIKEVGHDNRREKYHMYFSNNNTYESLIIEVMDENYIRASVEIIEKIEGDSSTRYAPDRKSRYYRITNGELDTEVIEEVFNDMESNE